MNREERKL